MVDVIIVGAGPSGLSCAIEAKKAGLTPLILEKGSVVDYIRRFPSNLIWFSTPELLEIGGVPFVVSTVRPTRTDVLNYYQKVAAYYNLDVRSHDEVESVMRTGDTFVITTRRNRKFETHNVVVATGYYDHPNRLDVPGEDLPKVFHHYTEPFAFFGCNVAVVGGRNSAVEAGLDLYRHGARITLIHRKEKLSDGVKYWILPDIENRIKAGEIKAFFNSTVQGIDQSSVLVESPNGRHEIPNDYAFVLIGFHPDTEHLRRWGVEVDNETLAPVFDERTHETNIRGLYVAGSVVAGKFNNKVFVENGRLHGKVIVSAILAGHR